MCVSDGGRLGGFRASTPSPGPWPPLEGPSAPTLLAAQSIFPQILIFGSQWWRVLPPWPLGCVDILLKYSRVKQARLFFMLSIIAKGRSILCSKSFNERYHSNLDFQRKFF